QSKLWLVSFYPFAVPGKLRRFVRSKIKESATIADRSCGSYRNNSEFLISISVFLSRGIFLRSRSFLHAKRRRPTRRRGEFIETRPRLRLLTSSTFSPRSFPNNPRDQNQHDKLR